MKIAFKIIRAKSGNDIYFERLREALKKINIDSEIIYYPKLFQFAPFLLKLFNRPTDADIVHSNVEYGWALKERHKPLYVSLLHNVFARDYERYTSLPQKIYYYLIVKPNIKKSLGSADRIIAISQFTKYSFQKTFGVEKIDVIYPPLDTSKYKPIKVKFKDKRLKLLFVGNLTRRKGADLLPKIMKKLGSDYVLYYTAGLRKRIPREFNLANMIPLGKLTEKKLIHEYNKCDALLFPTRLEGFGYCVAEAMACGKPVIVTLTSSLPEIVKDQTNGYLCKPDHIDEFVKKTRKILESKKNKRFRVINRISIKSKFEQSLIGKLYKAEILN